MFPGEAFEFAVAPEGYPSMTQVEVDAAAAQGLIDDVEMQRQIDEKARMLDEGCPMSADTSSRSVEDVMTDADRERLDEARPEPEPADPADDSDHDEQDAD